MTIEEAKTLAEQGNTGAMLALADFYSKQNNDGNALYTPHGLGRRHKMGQA